MDGGKEPYPKRPGEPDCRYYMNTGFCKFRTTCRFNHPLDREQVAAKDEYPERLGQAECQHYLKTGFCKFGAVCKYHHPREKARSTSTGEKECAIFRQSGWCKDGATCQFHHPHIPLPLPEPSSSNSEMWAPQEVVQMQSSEIHTSRQEMPEICIKTTDRSEPTTQSAAHEFLPTGNVSCDTRNFGTSNHETSNARSSSSKLVSSHDDVQTQERKIPEPTTKLAPQIEASKIHGTELSSRFDPPGSGTSNREIYESLLQDPVYSNWFKYFTDIDFSDMVVEQKFAEGGEAEIYEVKFGPTKNDVQTQERKIPEPRTKLARQIEASKIHWTELSSRFDSPGSGTVSNREIYESLLQDPVYANWFKGRIDVDFSDMVLGQKFAEGGEAEIYEVKFGRDTKPSRIHPRFVLKVFKEGYSLRNFQKQWPYSLPSDSIVQAGMVMEDDRFAYLLLRKAIDLRKLIDVAQEDPVPLWHRKQTRLEHLRTYQPKPRSRGCSTPIFGTRCARKIMFSIVWSMMFQHSSHGVHRDLKSSNVLCSDWEHDLDHDDSSKKWIYCEVADSESSIGSVGTGFWRAPEILLQLKEKRPKVHFTKEADVYSFAMVCYEIFTGHVPFEGYERDDYEDVLNGVRPTLPNHVPTWAQDLIRKCWHQDPSERPTFDDIWSQILNEDRLDEWRVFRYNPSIQKGPNISARVPLEGLDNSGGEVVLEDSTIVPSNEFCTICEKQKQKTHSN